MAARNPTSFTQFLNRQRVEAGKTVRTNPFDNALDDQQFLLDRSQTIICDGGQRNSDDFSFQTPQGTYSTLRFYKIQSKDMCGVAAETPHTAYFKYSTDVNGTTNVTVTFRISSTATGTSQVTVASALHSSDLNNVWASVGGLDVLTAGNVDDITVEASATWTGIGPPGLDDFQCFLLIADES